jgi:hypothetical protein
MPEARNGMLSFVATTFSGSVMEIIIILLRIRQALCVFDEE